MVATLQHAAPARGRVTAIERLEVRRSSSRASAPILGRVLARLFIPGQEGLIDGESRAGSVVDRVLVLDDDEAAAALGRRRGAASRTVTPTSLATLDEHFALVAHRIDDPATLSRDATDSSWARTSRTSTPSRRPPCATRRSCPTPTRTTSPPGELRVVMSLRAVGEGHLSTIEFRTGVLDAAGRAPPRRARHHVVAGRPEPPSVPAGSVPPGPAGRSTTTARVPRSCSTGSLTPSRGDELDHGAGDVARSAASRAARRRDDRPDPAGSPRPTTRSASRRRRRSRQRVLWPVAPPETHGMEDARFVRFVDDDGTVTYYATYTAYDGAHVAPQLLETDDFRTFRSHPAHRAEAPTNKGMALFPRDRRPLRRAVARRIARTTPIVTSDDPTVWDDAVVIQTPDASPGSWSSSATAARRSRPPRAGWSSPTASGRCAATPSAPCSSTSTTRRG